MPEPEVLLLWCSRARAAPNAAMPSAAEWCSAPPAASPALAAAAETLDREDPATSCTGDLLAAPPTAAAHAAPPLCDMDAENMGCADGMYPPDGGTAAVAAAVTAPDPPPELLGLDICREKIGCCCETRPPAAGPALLPALAMAPAPPWAKAAASCPGAKPSRRFRQ